jgi:hypothetical protein
MRIAGAYALVAAILAAVFAASLLGGGYRAIERSDYMTYHVAARIVLAGDGDCLYDVACQAAAQRELIGEEPSFARGPLPSTPHPGSRLSSRRWASCRCRPASRCSRSSAWPSSPGARGA